MGFKLNNDLNRISPRGHNKWHFVICLVGAAFWNPILTYLIMLLWDIGDGFKPWYKKFKYDPNKPKWLNWLIENTLYADGFSLQDVLIWNLSGTIVGTLLKFLYMLVI